jgi:hypothetical protein
MTPGIMTLSIRVLNFHTQYKQYEHKNNQYLMLLYQAKSVMMIVVAIFYGMLSFIMLSIVMKSVVMLSVVLPSVGVPTIYHLVPKVMSNY